MKRRMYLLIPVLLAGCSCQPSAQLRSTATADSVVVQMDSTGADVLHGIDSVLRTLPADSTFVLPRAHSIIDLGEVEVQP